MQDPSLSTPDKVTASPAPTEGARTEASKLDQSLAALRGALGEHKGKLAIGAAAMLGLMVYYKWKERSLAQEDPEEYERLQRIKNRVRRADERNDLPHKTDGLPHPSDTPVNK